jgi:HEAT repeat protein
MRPILFVILLLSLSGCVEGPPAPDTGARVRHWIEALGQADAKMRKEAAFKLGNLGLTDPISVVHALTAALKDADAGVRCAVILALLKCGPVAKEAIHELTEVQQEDRDAKVRDYAAKALQRLKGGQ